MSYEIGLQQIEQNQPEILQPGGAMLASEFFDRESMYGYVERLIEQRKIDIQSELKNEIWDNSRTALFEALTASGHLTKVDFEGPVEQVNEQVLQRLLNAWDETLPEWEKRRRFLEIAEEVTIQRTYEAIKNGQLPEDTMVATISDFPSDVDPQAAVALGYRSLNHKGMCRVSYFFVDEKGDWRRGFEQVSRSNSLDKSSVRAISRLTGQPQEWLQGSNEVLSSQLLVTSDILPEGAVDLQRILDEESDIIVRYGDRQPHNHPEYEDLKFVSAEREMVLGGYVEQLSKIERQLNRQMRRGKIDYNEKLQQYHEAIESMINEICLLSPEYARDARGKDAEPYFLEASRAMAAGDHERGMYMFEQALDRVDPDAKAICGGIGMQDNLQPLPGTIEHMYKRALETGRGWSFNRLGTCIVKTCGKTTYVGPCSVCKSCTEADDRKNALK